MMKVLAAMALLCLVLVACGGDDHPAPCDTCDPGTPQDFSTCFSRACSSVCGQLTAEECMLAMPEVVEPILGCVDVCDGCFTGLSCAACEGPACPTDAPGERCAAFNGTTTCSDGVYTGTNG